MVSRLFVFLIPAILMGACRQSGQSLQRQQQQYDVVQEGASSTVTGSIGEGTATTATTVTTALTPTDTGADTTTSFTLGGPAPVGNSTPGSLAGTLPASTGARGVESPLNRNRITRKTLPADATSTDSTDVSSHDPARPAASDPAVKPTVNSVPTETASSSSSSPRPLANDRKRDVPPPDPAPTPAPPPPTDTTGTQGDRLRP